jgi:hypothetical protein
MTLRIGQKRFFVDTYRTRNKDTITENDQAECENAVEKLFREFLHQQSSIGLK